jgi:hypothetical protein
MFAIQLAAATVALPLSPVCPCPTIQWSPGVLVATIVLGMLLAAAFITALVSVTVYFVRKTRAELPPGPPTPATH